VLGVEQARRVLHQIGRPLRIVLRREVRVPGAVGAFEQLPLAHLMQPLAGILAHRLEQLVAGRATLAVDAHERLFDQAAEQLEDRAGSERLTAAYLLGGLEAEAAGEDGEPPEQHALVGAEQLVAPVERGRERPLPRKRRAAARAEHAERVAQPLQYLFRREHADPCRRQLERERHAVEPDAELGHRAGVAHVDLEAGRSVRSPFGKQPHRPQAHEIGGRRQPLEVRQRERRDAPRDLALDPERLTARREQHHPGAGAHDRGGKRRAGIDQVLAVVEHDERVAVAELLNERRLGVPPVGQCQAQRGRHLGRHQLGVSERGELHQPGAVLKRRHAPRREFAGKPALARPASPAEGQQPGAGEQPVNFTELPLATDEAGRLVRQVVPPRRRDRNLRRAGFGSEGARQQVAVEAPALRVGIGAKDLPQRGPQPLVLRQRLLAPAAVGERAHQGAVRRLMQRLGRDRSPQ
jgi:hypothetical protein